MNTALSGPSRRSRTAALTAACSRLDAAERSHRAYHKRRDLLTRGRSCPIRLVRQGASIPKENRWMAVIRPVARRTKFAISSSCTKVAILFPNRIPLNGLHGLRTTNATSRILRSAGKEVSTMFLVLDRSIRADGATTALRADLCTPTWDLKGRGILLENKEEVRKRLGRSPGKGDSVVMAPLGDKFRQKDGADSLDGMSKSRFIELS
jgi:hypothetical protein